jgi:probable HAF family extracellular repeat protein
MKTKLLGVVAALAISAFVSPASAISTITYGFLYNSDGSYTNLTACAGCLIIPFDINNTGQIVGQVDGGPNGGFIYSGGTYTYVNNGIPHGINDTGQIVGGGSYNNISIPPSSLPPISGGYQGVPTGINNAGQEVGYFFTSATPLPGVIYSHRGFLYSGGTYSTLAFPGAINTVAWGINDAGQIVGSYSNSNGYAAGFLYSGGVYTSIGTNLYGINNLGQIVGDGGVYSNGIFTALALGPRAIDINVLGINDAGQIVGDYDFITPLPPTWTMLLPVLMGIGLVAHRRNGKSAVGATTA